MGQGRGGTGGRRRKHVDVRKWDIAGASHVSQGWSLLDKSRAVG